MHQSFFSKGVMTADTVIGLDYVRSVCYIIRSSSVAFCAKRECPDVSAAIFFNRIPETHMKIISTNIGRIREILYQEKMIKTGIYKEPVEAIDIRKFFVAEDTVSDVRVHGGEYKAVYGYPSEHYEFWRSQYPDVKMEWGMFGENITTEGLLETDILIGSVYRIGTALLQITEARMPCFKLAAKFGSNDIIRRFMKSRKSGFYCTVLEEGRIHAGDAISMEREGTPGYTIVDDVKKRERDE
jgi:MOSC domain-containing protein YiiM